MISINDPTRTIKSKIFQDPPKKYCFTPYAANLRMMSTVKTATRIAFTVSSPVSYFSDIPWY